MPKKLLATRYLLYALSAVVLLGLGLLLARQVLDVAGVAFDVMTYILSVAALALAVLSVINSIHQQRAMRRMVREVHAAVTELEEVADTNEAIERKVRDEHRVSTAIAEVLVEYGMGENEKVRKAIAHRVGKKLKKASKTS